MLADLTIYISVIAGIEYEIQCHLLCFWILGHSFEARIYAENVPKGFLPATGTLHHYRPVPVSPTGIAHK